CDLSSKSQMSKRWQEAFEPALPNNTEHRAIRYALVILIAVAALLFRKALVPVLGQRNPYHIAWLAVVFAAWYCGLWQAIVALTIETLGIWYWFIPTYDTWRIDDRRDIYGVVSFVLLGGFIIGLGESCRRTAARRATSEEEAHRTTELA